LRAGIGGIDGVVFTHDHADHTHGVYELKAISENRGHQIDAFLAANTWNSLRLRFAPYFASTDEGKSGAFLNDRLVTPGEPFSVRGAGDDIRVSIFRQEHGDTETVGIKVGAFVYSVDLKILPRSSLEELSEVDTWVLDCLRYREHPSHVNLEEALALVQRVKPRLAVLTGLSADFDYRKLTAQLPRGVVVAYDGMILEMR
jgi:phosphoribosyl 1,2-cyclic phosphate phosphodiesterase